MPAPAVKTLGFRSGENQMNDPTFMDFCGPFGAMLVAALAMAPPPVWAAAKVSGGAEAVTVEAQDSSLQEIFALLSRDFHMQYRAPSNFNGRVTGTYKGSLPQVVSHLLDGRNFVVESNPGGLAVTVFGGANTTGTVGGSFPQPMWQSPNRAVRSRSPPPSNSASPIRSPSVNIGMTLPPMSAPTVASSFHSRER
jgi:hypothetical protein